ncbi:MAG: response regulator [Pirellulaceae bacterium]|nr:response regulator [Pirellulaceae bacterium]
MSTMSDHQQVVQVPLYHSELWGLESKWLDLLPMGVYFCDADGVLLRWNRYAVKLWVREPRRGDTQEKFCGSLRLFKANGEALAHAACPMANALRTQTHQRIPEVIIGRPDGSQRIVSVTIDPIWDESGKLAGAVNVFQDITQQRRAERARNHVEKRFFRLLQKLPAAAYSCDADGLITYFNSRAEELWGRSPTLNDPVDRFCGSFRLFSPDGKTIQHENCWMALALRNQRDYEGEEILIERPDGSRRSVLAYATPFREDSSNIVGAVNVLIDITDRKQAQARISQLLANEKEQSEQLREADRRKDEFLAMLAHELRNPLAPIRSGLDILAMDPRQEQETVELMQDQLEHLVRLVDDLLDVSRIMRGRIELRRETVPLSELIERSVDAVRPMIRENEQELTVSLPCESIYLDVDPVRFVQVIGNLLTNASKYTDPGGSITLTAALMDDQVKLTIEDTGVGIDQELLPRVFELFAQSSRSLDRSKGGLGIGLTLAKNLIEMHGGSISVHSDGKDCGSTFVIHLNYVDDPMIEVVETKPAEICKPRRILVVDDNRGAAFLLGRLLQKLADHEIETAHDGPTALELALAMRPDIILLDIGLPLMDGFQVGQTIRNNPELDDTLLVAVTGYGQETDRQRSIDAGFDEHLVKPPSIDQMRSILSHSKLK